MAEPKSLLEIVLMPLAVALVGIVGTFLITQQQLRATEAQAAVAREAAQARAAADRQVQILEIFADKITSVDESDRALAMYATLSLDHALAAKLLPTFLVKQERSDTLNDTLETVTQAIVLHRTRAPGSVPPIVGRWRVLRSDQLRHWAAFENWMDIEATPDGALGVEGIGWRGRGAFDGAHGHYDWTFDHVDPENPESPRTGRTNFYLDDSGLLFGHVKGSGLDWTYWAYSITNPG